MPRSSTAVRGTDDTKTKPDGGAEEEAIPDHNGFEAMLAVPREAWVVGQPGRMQDLIAVTACLERLGVDLLSRRRDCL